MLIGISCFIKKEIRFEAAHLQMFLEFIVKQDIEDILAETPSEMQLEKFLCPFFFSFSLQGM